MTAEDRVAELEAIVERLRAELCSCRQEHKTELSERGQLDRQLLEAMPAGVVRVRSDGSIDMANAAALDFLGLEFDEITERYTSDFVAMEESGEVANPETFPVSRTLATGERSGPIVYGVVRPGGDKRWGTFSAVPVKSDSGDTVAALVTFVDVTTGHIAELKLRESESQLWSYLEASPAIIMYLDRDLQFQFLNRYTAGHRPETTIGRYLGDYLPPTDHDRVIAVVESVIETGEPGWYEIPPNEGVWEEWYSVVVGPVRRGGEIVGVVLISNDVTDRIELQSRLLVADRLASLGTLAAGVAHEINNPLTYVMANLRRLSRCLEEQSVDVASAGWVADAYEGTERIRNVVRDLSSLSSTPSARTGLIDVRDALGSAIRMIRVELQHRAQLVTDIRDVPRVRGDESHLFQVFLNLMINAAQAVPVGDAIRNEVRVTARENDEGWVLVEVEDTGCGVEADLRTRIFEPFVTSKGEDSGTGLGLYVSSTLIKGLGGRLSLESDPGEGACFRVMLPPAKEPRAGSEPPIVGMPASDRARILVVDDEDGVLRFMKDALAGHDVVVVSSGTAALEAIAKRSFDVVFCDLIMPSMSGADLYSRVRADAPDVAERFVFMTGGAFTPESSQFVASVERPILQKPFAISEIFAQVSRLVGAEHAAENEEAGG